MRIHTSLPVSNLAFSLLAWRSRQLLACPPTFFKIPHSFVVLLTAMTSSRSFWKDPLEVLPHLPHPLPLPRSVTVKLSCMKLLTRVNETISCLRGLYKGELVNGQQEVANVSRSSIKAGWSRSTGPQRQLVRRVWDAHAEWMAEEIVHDDDTALTQMLRAVPVALQTEPLTKTPEPVRGDLCACVASEVSLPPSGATPVPLKDTSPDAAEFFAAWQSSMLRQDSEVDWEEYEKIKPYQSPELQSKKFRLELLLRMWLCGMLSTCSKCCEEVRVFTVLKKDENGIRSSRLMWDLRQANLRWRTPPCVPLGSPISIGCLDLAEDWLEGKTLSSCQGDFPDFFHMLLLPAEMWSYFVFAAASPQDLKEYAHQQGIEVSIDAAHAHLCLIALSMGWVLVCEAVPGGVSQSHTGWWPKNWCLLVKRCPVATAKVTQYQLVARKLRGWCPVATAKVTQYRLVARTVRIEGARRRKPKSHSTGWWPGSWCVVVKRCPEASAKVTQYRLVARNLVRGCPEATAKVTQYRLVARKSWDYMTLDLEEYLLLVWKEKQATKRWREHIGCRGGGCSGGGATSTASTSTQRLASRGKVGSSSSQSTQLTRSSSAGFALSDVLAVRWRG